MRKNEVAKVKVFQQIPFQAKIKSNHLISKQWGERKKKNQIWKYLENTAYLNLKEFFLSLRMAYKIIT